MLHPGDTGSLNNVATCRLAVRHKCCHSGLGASGWQRDGAEGGARVTQAGSGACVLTKNLGVKRWETTKLVSDIL